MKKKESHFDKFKPKKSNAAIKEQFKQEKRKYKKEKEEFFDKKKAEVRAQQSAVRSRGAVVSSAPTPIIHARKETSAQMPLNKFIAHSGICGRREAAELVKKGMVKVNGKVVTEPGFKVLHNG